MNTQRILKASLIAALAVAAIAPAASQAASQKGLNACVEAFARDHLPAGHPVRVVKRAQTRSMYMSISSPETFEVQAKGSESGDSYGSAKCVVDRKGQVLAMQVEGSSIRLAKGIESTQASGG